MKKYSEMFLLLLIFGCTTTNPYNLQEDVFYSQKGGVLFQREKPYFEVLYLTPNNELINYGLSKSGDKLIIKEKGIMDSIPLSTFIQKRGLKSMIEINASDLNLEITEGKQLKEYDEWFKDSVDYTQFNVLVIYDTASLFSFTFKSTSNLDSNFFSYKIYQIGDTFFFKGKYNYWTYKGLYDGHLKTRYIEFVFTSSDLEKAK